MHIVWIVLACMALAIVFFVFWQNGYISIKTKTRSVNPAKYLGKRANPSSIYNSSGRGFFHSPFTLSLEAMDRLLLVDIDDDTEYATIELQVFDDEKGRGAVVLLYRKNGEIDTCYTSGLNREVYQHSSKGYAYSSDNIAYRFDVTEMGLDASLDLEDRDGKKMTFTIQENQPAKKTFDILAPAGAMIDDFAGFPFFYMKRTAFVERAGTHIHVEIDGTQRKPASIPIAINGAFVYLARYCTEPIVGTWNEAFTGLLEPISPGQADSSGQTYQLVENNGHHEIARVIRPGHGHTISLTFSPPIPELACLRDGVIIEGRFTAGADDTDGIVAGRYSLHHAGVGTQLVMQPAKGWQPMPGRPWVRSYRWQANVESDSQGKMTIKSAWARNPA